LHKKKKPSESIVAYNIGLFESEDGYMAYLIGSQEYDESNDDWACNEDFVPRKKYFNLPNSKDKKWEIILEEVKVFMKEFMKSDSAKESFFSYATAITVGFDEGDLIKVK